MRNIFKITIIAALFLVACKDEDTLPVNFDDLISSGGAFATEIGGEGLTNVNKLDPTVSTFSKSYQLITPKNGVDVTKLDIYVNFSGLNLEVDEVLYSTINSDSFTDGGAYPEATVSVNGESILNALGILSSDLEGGDTFNFRLALTNADGTFSDVSANFDNQSADHNFAATVVCELPTPPIGDWVVKMEDTFGDGWQTTTGNGGPGITVTLDTGVVIEVGLCTPYEPNDYDCIADNSSGTAIVTIPDGTLSADWYFPGDFWGEIKFEIFAPSGNLVASYSPGSGAGPIALNLCNEI